MGKKRNTRAATPAQPAPPAQPSRGQQRRQQQRKQRSVTAAAVPSQPAAPVDAPAFFYGFEVSWAKLVLARVVVFALLALDAMEQISHAPRYGAGGFNVAQLPFLDAIAPGRELYSIAQLVSAYLFVLAACGVATRVVVPIATAIYGWLYFGSHLDSYQHHYLVFWLLVVASFVPWQRPADATPGTRVRSWALRLLLLELGILYFWAAISKLDGAWLDGRTLAIQMNASMKSLIQSTVGMAGASWIVMLVELALAVTVWLPRAWPVAAPLGLALHLGIAWSGLEIGLFAWLMVGLYILVVPDRIWLWIADRSPVRALRAVARVVSGWFDGSMRFAVWVVAAAAGAVLAMVSRFDHGPAVGLWLVVALIVGTVFAVLRRRTHVAWLAVAHLLAFMLWTAVDRTTATASDYFRLWGGSSRRLGDSKTSEHAYRRMTEVAPGEGNGFYQLGKLLLARGAGEEGLAALRRAQDLEPLRARSYVAEARWLAQHGQRAEAIAKLREALIVEPTDQEAKALLDSLVARP